MSWFKRKSPEASGRNKSDTDPITCLEVFQNHWKQACTVISGQDRKVTVNGHATIDGVETVLHNLEQMVTLLVGEDDDGGLPGPILNFVLETELFESFCCWCSMNTAAHERLRLQELRLFELVISQSKQLLLVHKPVIKPLLKLLIEVADSNEIANMELEFKLVLVLHQICICISQQSLILESFFSTDADHGPARFLIFSLLIPYIHREGPVGQKARDALLLIMTLSSRHLHIGQYIANNSDFCPVLATGLSGLYSSLPRRINPPAEDWYAITKEDCVRIPDLQMFLNSLQFSNAVVQIAHPSVRDQLIMYIYTGFLLPVLAPALHQDISGLPIPLLDTDTFRVSREEVMTATAYLDLFIRHVTDPHLLKATLKFVLTEKYEDGLILDSLMSRINSGTHLSTVTLALFHSLVELNCEDVMFQLVFRYLIPCTHVMVSQRRSVRDIDLYGKSAEKFLSLRPSCCLPVDESANTSANTSNTSGSSQTLNSQSNQQKNSREIFAKNSSPSTLNNTVPRGNNLLGESSYFEYLYEARNKLSQSALACRHWLYPYDGETPTPDFLSKPKTSSLENEEPQKGFMDVGSIVKNSNIDKEEKSSENVNRVSFDIKENNSEGSEVSSKDKSNEKDSEKSTNYDQKLYESLKDVDLFINYLQDTETNEDSHLSLSEIASSLSVLIDSFTSSERGSSFIEQKSHAEVSSESLNLSSLSPIADKTPNSDVNDSQFSFISSSEIPVNDIASINPANKTSFVDISASEVEPSKTSYDEINPSEVPVSPNIAMQPQSADPNTSSYLNISIVPEEIKPSSITSTPAAKLANPAVNRVKNVPRSFPKSFESNTNPLYLLSTALSPVKSHGDSGIFFKSLVSPAEEFSVMTPLSPGPKRPLNYLNDPPNIGPFLGCLLSRLENMIGNSLFFNLLLTNILSKLASYPQPLIRSFLLNHNLVFQPSVKSLVQVLSSLRQKIESFSFTVNQFDTLVSSARDNLYQREELMFQTLDSGYPGNSAGHPVLGLNRQRAETLAVATIREKKKVTLSDFFRRSPGREKLQVSLTNKNSLETLNSGPKSGGSSSFREDNNQSMTTWNAVYSALILDEFLKELSALSQEHSVLQVDEGYLSS